MRFAGLTRVEGIVYKFTQKLSKTSGRTQGGAAGRGVTWVQWQLLLARRHGRSAQLGCPFFERLQSGEMSPSGLRAFSSRPRHAGAAPRKYERLRG